MYKYLKDSYGFLMGGSEHLPLPKDRIDIRFLTCDELLIIGRPWGSVLTVQCTTSKSTILLAHQTSPALRMNVYPKNS